MTVGVISLEVGSVGSGNGVELDIFPGTLFDFEQIDLRKRTAQGRFFSYTYGEKNRYRIALNHVPSSIGAIVNSYWTSGTVLGVTHDVVTIAQARIVNDKTPLAESPEMYHDELFGIIELLDY